MEEAEEDIPHDKTGEVADNGPLPHTEAEGEEDTHQTIEVHRIPPGAGHPVDMIISNNPTDRATRIPVLVRDSSLHLM